MHGGPNRGRPAEEALENLENKLRRAFEKHAGDNGVSTEGIIGISSRDRLTRHPSSIYWWPMRELGILRKAINRGTWARGLHAWSKGDRIVKDDDGTTHLDDDGSQVWDGRALRVGPLQDGEIPDSLDPALDKDAAIYLRQRFLNIDSRRKFTSLLGHLVDRRSTERFALAWDVSAIPKDLKPHVEDARRFSLFARGATLHYNHLVTRRKHDRVETLADPDIWVPAFDDWWQRSHIDLAGWNTATFKANLTKCCQRVKSGAPSTSFCDAWLKRLRQADSSEAFLADEKARYLVRKQEADNKPSRARLVHTDRLHGWREGDGATTRWLYHLHYRAPRASGVLDDIVTALEDRP